MRAIFVAFLDALSILGRAKSDLGFLVQKEFKQFFRNSFLPRMLVGFPIMAILVIPWVANMEIKNINLSIVDFDKSTLSNELVAKIEAGDYFKVAQNALSFESAKECIYLAKCDIIVEIPNDFEANMLSQSASIALYANAINSTKGTLGAGYLSNIIAEFSAEKNAKILDSRGASGATSANNGTNSATFSHSGANLGNLEILSLYAYNPHLDYKLYMIPALTVMVLTLLCGFLPAFNIIGEKQSGNIEQINVSPLPKSLFIISKVIPYWIMGIVVVSLCFLLAFVVYGFASRGGYGSIFVFALVYILVVTGLGLVISNYSNTMQQAMFVSYFFILILILLSGLFTSIKSMPLWAEMLTLANPLRYFIESLRAIFLKGDSLLNSPFLWWNLCALVGFAFVFNLWAIVSYKKQS